MQNCFAKMAQESSKSSDLTINIGQYQKEERDQIRGKEREQENRF